MQPRKASVSKILTYLVLCFWGLTTVYPFLWVILNSFRKKGLILSDSFYSEDFSIFFPARGKRPRHDFRRHRCRYFDCGAVHRSLLTIRK